MLYNAEAAACVAAVVARALQPMTPAQRRGGGMALLSDPEQRTNRAEFEKAAAALGLETVDAEFPGHAGMKLLQANRPAA